MAQARKYHAPGVGGRTGMKVGEDVRSLSGYFNAGQQHMNQSYDDDDDGDDDDDDDDDDEEEDEGDEEEESRDDSALVSPARTKGRKSSAMGRKSNNAPGSSSMDLENSYAPSPNRSRRTAPGNDDSFPLDDSLIDYGDDPQEYSGDGAGPSAGHQSLSVVSPIGRGRNRPSGAGSLRDQSVSRRQSGRSSFDLNNDSINRSAGDDIPMDMGGDEMPSFNMDANDVEDPEDALGSGDEVEDGVRVEYNAGAEALEGTSAGKAERESAKRGKKGKKGEIRVVQVERSGSGPLSAKDREIKEKVPRSRGGSVIDGDVRRSTRHRYAPLEYWRGERAIYGPAQRRKGAGSRHRVRDSADQDGEDETVGDDTIEADAFEDAPIKSYAVPVLKEVIRIRRDVDEGTFSGLKIKRKGINGRVAVKGRKKRKVSRRADGESEDDEPDPTQPTRHPEEGWDEATDPHGMVWDVERQSEVERRIACPISQVRPKTAINSDFAFEKVFGVDDYMAAGILEIPVGGGKPSKPTKDNNYTFVVLEGAVDVQVHRTKFTIAPGGMFMVPKGNVYSIHNRCQRTCRIFFAQARQAQPRKDMTAIKGGAQQQEETQAPLRPAGVVREVEEAESRSRAGSRVNGSHSPVKRGRGGGTIGKRGGATSKRGRK